MVIPFNPRHIVGTPRAKNPSPIRWSISSRNYVRSKHQKISSKPQHTARRTTSTSLAVWSRKINCFNRLNWILKHLHKHILTQVWWRLRVCLCEGCLYSYACEEVYIRNQFGAWMLSSTFGRQVDCTWCVCAGVRDESATLRVRYLYVCLGGVCRFCAQNNFRLVRCSK